MCLKIIFGKKLIKMYNWLYSTVYLGGECVFVYVCMWKFVPLRPYCPGEQRYMVIWFCVTIKDWMLLMCSFEFSFARIKRIFHFENWIWVLFETTITKQHHYGSTWNTDQYMRGSCKSTHNTHIHTHTKTQSSQRTGAERRLYSWVNKSSIPIPIYHTPIDLLYIYECICAECSPPSTHVYYTPNHCQTPKATLSDFRFRTQSHTLRK